MKRTLHVSLSLLILLGLVIGSAVSAVGGNHGNHRNHAYQVTVTNVTQDQTFTPILVATHKREVKIFMLGEPASEELARLAEGGATMPLAESLKAMASVGQVVDSGGLLMPGETVTVTVEAGKKFPYLSLAAMLVPTNDGFIALNGVKLPRGHKTTHYFSPVYDAGSEMNDESCDNIPAGADCGGVGFNEDDGEGYVHVHAGIHGTGDLEAAQYDWRNPAAKITIQRVGENDDDD